MKRLLEVGAHLPRERRGATGKNGIIQEILNLNWKQIEIGSDVDWF